MASLSRTERHVPQCACQYRQVVKGVVIVSATLVVIGVALSFFSHAPSPLINVFTKGGATFLGISAALYVVNKCGKTSRKWLISLVASTVILTVGIILSWTLPGHASSVGSLLWKLSLSPLITSVIGYGFLTCCCPQRSSVFGATILRSSQISAPHPRDGLIGYLESKGYKKPAGLICSPKHVDSPYGRGAFRDRNRFLFNSYTAELVIWIGDLPQFASSDPLSAGQNYMVIATPPNSAPTVTPYPSEYCFQICHYDSSTAFAKLWDASVDFPFITD